LDRCRPDFAVSILEVIKHVFDVEGIKFVLVTNLNQMKASINHCYGQAVNAHHYLDKFIKHSFKLPLDIKDELNQQIHVSCKHAEILIQNNKTLEKNLYGIQSLSFIKELIIQNELSLRQVETFIRYLSIYTVL
ncbi:TPA: AAA family ATPase, partial [Legionella pneumophila]|nr:AAA family ATPase [Legionella pneumophila]